MAEGRLVGLARWPVKSLGGEALAAARLDWRGLGGDGVLDPEGGPAAVQLQLAQVVLEPGPLDHPPGDLLGLDPGPAGQPSGHGLGRAPEGPPVGGPLVGGQGVAQR